VQPSGPLAAELKDRRLCDIATLEPIPDVSTMDYKSMITSGIQHQNSLVKWK